MWFSSLLGLSLVAAAAPSIDQALPEAASRGDLAAIQALLEAETDVDQAQGDGMTALHWAAYRDELPMAELLLAAEATVDAATRMGGVTPLFLAAKNGSAPMIERLAESGANVNRVTDTGASPLMAAAMSGNVEAIKALLEREADVNGREHHNGQTPLMFAAWENRAEAIRALIAAGAHTELTSNILVLQEDRYDADGNPRPRREGREQSRANAAMGGMTALLFAAREGHMESVRALVEAGADIDRASGSDASTPIVIAIANGHYDVGQYLLDQGADVRAANLDGLTPLYATVNMRYAPVSWAPNPRTDQETVDSLDLMRRILEAGADPNARVRSKLWFSPTSHDRGWVEHNGATPFWRAAMSSDVEAMRVLVQGGADPKLATHDGITPLMVAAGLGWIGNFSQNAPGLLLRGGGVLPRARQRRQRGRLRGLHRAARCGGLWRQRHRAPSRRPRSAARSHQRGRRLRGGHGLRPVAVLHPQARDGRPARRARRAVPEQLPLGPVRRRQVQRRPGSQVARAARRFAQEPWSFLAIRSSRSASAVLPWRV